ncbi:MAG: (Fe-S)-binding protein [Bdellovibrionales bacterium]|nr:(Fe-S)-binding protein [Bdellovibrionales bacterium]
MASSMEQATREILWNVGSPLTGVIMYSLMTVSLIVAAIGVVSHIEGIASGKPAPSASSSENFFARVRSLITNVLFQRKVLSKPGIGLTHTLIYSGFLVLLFTTTMVFIDHDLGIRIYEGSFYLAVTVMSDLLGFALIVGIALAAHRRFIQKPDLVHNLAADSYLLWMLALLCVQGFLLEGLRIHVTDDPWRTYSPIGNLVSHFFWGLSPSSASSLHFFTWWFHTVTVFVFVGLLPYSKFFHVIASAANLYFAPRSRPKGRLQSPGDLEKLMSEGSEDDFRVGLESLRDYSWKQLLDLDACTSCGRCQEQCPAYNSGKPLSPKWMVLDTRNHFLSLLAQGKLGQSRLPTLATALNSSLTLNYLERSSGVRPAEEGEGFLGNGTFRARNEEVQHSVRKIGESAEARISGDVMDPNVFWTCNTCYACVEACPVGINHVDLIVGNRQNMVLMQGEIPSEAQGTLRALENRENPYGAPEDRANWVAELDIPLLTAGSKVDYLYWVGCVSAYDPRKQKIARALVQLMKKAGLNFGILGTAEGCSGDPARRLGEENLFQTLAKKNIETLKSISFKTLVANCPHCFNTIKNEYPEFGNLGEGRQPEIIHHSVLLKRLVQNGTLQIRESAEQITFHDPCYLGRYNDEYEAPRDALKANSRLAILEPEASKNKGLCCGAGGGHFWMDLKIGERVNVQRVNQLAATGAKKIATACPFCMQMIEDGVKLTDREETHSVRDIAEVLLESLHDPSESGHHH